MPSAWNFPASSQIWRAVASYTSCWPTDRGADEPVATPTARAGRRRRRRVRSSSARAQLPAHRRRPAVLPGSRGGGAAASGVGGSTVTIGCRGLDLDLRWIVVVVRSGDGIGCRGGGQRRRSGADGCGPPRAGSSPACGDLADVWFGPFELGGRVGGSAHAAVGVSPSRRSRITLAAGSSRAARAG